MSTTPIVLLFAVVTGCTPPPAEPDTDPPDTDLEGIWHEPCPMDAWEQRRITVGDLVLNVGCRGDGPTVVLLHGFPEFHHAWHAVADELAGEYRLVVPDQRGYNLSDKPEEVEAYVLPKLAADIRELLTVLSVDPVLVVAHDWGGPVGWLLAHDPSAKVRGLLATNGPHPVRFVDLLANDADQQAASAYMEVFRSPEAETYLTPDALAEMLYFLEPEDLELYREAWSQPGAITGGLNWYRANLLTPESIEEAMSGLSPTVPIPVTVMWGLDDPFVLASNAEDLEQYAPDLVVETFPGVDHWIEHRIPEEIARAIRELDARSAN